MWEMGRIATLVTSRSGRGICTPTNWPGGALTLGDIAGEDELGAGSLTATEGDPAFHLKGGASRSCGDAAHDLLNTLDPWQGSSGHNANMPIAPGTPQRPARSPLTELLGGEGGSVR